MNPNKYRRLEKLRDRFKSDLNLLNLAKLNPIFSEPDIAPFRNPINEPHTNPPDAILVSYPDVVLGERLRNAIPNIKVPDPRIQNFLDNITQHVEIEESMWIVFDNLVMYFPHEVVGNIYKSQIKYCRIKESPFYIQALMQPVAKVMKKSVVIITDELPFSISLMIYRDPYKKQEREDVLFYLSRILGCFEAKEIETQEAKAQEVIAIISDERISFKEALDKLNSFVGGGGEGNFSYCLTCGDRIDAGKKFCNAEAKGYKQKNNCLNRFNNWLKARLKIKTARGRNKKRVEFYEELRALTTTNPFSAFDIFKTKYSKLYTSRYKERWIRVRNQS